MDVLLPQSPEVFWSNYFLVCNGEEKLFLQINCTVTGYVVQFFNLRNSFLSSPCSKWEPFLTSMQLRNRFLYKYEGLPWSPDAFVLFFSGGIAGSILLGVLFESAMGALCGVFSLFLVPYFLYDMPSINLL